MRDVCVRPPVVNPGRKRAQFQRSNRGGTTIRATSLHDERAVHAQERRLMSLNHPLFDCKALEQVKRVETRQPGPIEDDNQHRRGQFEGRLCDRQHAPGVLAARAIVLVLIGSLARRGPVMIVTVITGARMAVAMAVSCVVAPAVLNRNQLGFAGRCRVAGQASGKKRAEIAAAKRHGQRQEQRQHKPE